MKKYLLSAVFASAIANAQIPTGYYDGTSGLSGYALKEKVHQIIAAKNINWNYGDLPNFYNQTDLDKYYDHGVSNTTFLLDIYSEIPTGPDAYEYTSANLIAGAGAEGLGYNREHMMPQSTFSTSSAISDYPMYSDLHFIIPADARINTLRNNYPYGVAGSTIYYTFTNGSKIGNAAIPNYPYLGRVYEPIDEFKGDVARTLLYFAVRYQGKLSSFNTAYTTSSTITPATDQCPLDGTEERAVDLNYIAMLKQWNTLDPVSQREIDRNNAVYNLQKNRNPFVDHPEWINIIWSETPDNIAPDAPTSLVSTQQGAYFVNLQWSASISSDVLGYRIYVNGSTTPSAVTKNNSVTIDHLLPGTNYTFAVKAFDKAYLESVSNQEITVATTASGNFAKDLMITKYIEGTGFNKAIEITNKTGHAVNLNNYRLNIQFQNTTSGSFYNGNTYELEGSIENNESFVILNPNSALACYTNSTSKFVTASDPMIFSGTQYVELAYNKTIAVDVIGSKFVSNTNADVSLYRKNTVTQPSSTFSLTEWDSYPVNFCQNAGSLAVENIGNSDSSLKIYPNPVHDVLNIQAENNLGKIEILDFSGRVLKSFNEKKVKNLQINVSDLSPGDYILKVDGSSFKFIKI
ncbi:endonuclease I [Chryseobacterium sp. Leaf180]|uniref:endonuclease n=1 Tax=Chryseobacterium sp. Leaf180 TaxID=1736289 RepID=UPI0006F5732B|nr:endonuclease [Chryseobacterium sp. Leaf180]KQR94642.1 endonuclease I [Chryseobacterium sp. Leaf180]